MQITRTVAFACCTVIACGSSRPVPASPEAVASPPAVDESVASEPAPPLAPPAPVDPNVALLAGLGLPPLSYVAVREHGDVLLRIPGPAPAWEELRALGRKAFAAAGALPTSAAKPPPRVHLWFDEVGKLATADNTGSTLRVSVGDGWYMMPDRATYTLEATYDVTVMASMYKQIALGASGRPKCAGTVRNIGPTPLALSAHCIIATFTTFDGTPTMAGALAKRVVFHEHTDAIGTVEPGKEKKFSILMPPLPKVKEGEFKGSNPLTGTLQAEVELLADGKVVETMPRDAPLLASIWLAVIDALAVDGVRPTTSDPSGDTTGMWAKIVSNDRTRLRLRVPNDLPKWPADKQAAFVQKLDKQIAGFYKLTTARPPMIILSTRSSEAKIENGRLSAWGSFVF